MKLTCLTTPKTAILLIIAVMQLAACQNDQKVGLQLYSFRNELPKDVNGVLAKIKEMGIEELEGGELYDLPADEYTAMISKNGLVMVGVHAEFAELDSNIQKVIDRAKLFNAAYATCYWIPQQSDTFGIEEAKASLEVFTKAGKILAENGIALCYHPHGYEFVLFGDETPFDYMVKNSDKKYLNFELDVFWAKQGGADPVALMEKYPDRIPMLHLKDRAHGTPGSIDGQADVETNVTLGSGDVEIAAVMEAAKKIGVKHYFIEDESSRCMQQVPASVKYLREWGF